VADLKNRVVQKQKNNRLNEIGGNYLMVSKIFTRGLGTGLVLALATPAFAQTTEVASDEAGLSEIIVTATRRDSNLQTTPIAITAVDQTIIEQASPDNIGDLASFVPNFSAAKITGFNAASFAMRGVGQNNIIVYFGYVVVLPDDACLLLPN
jgi:outer membrane receptor protein involved in Fe transport